MAVRSSNLVTFSDVAGVGTQVWGSNPGNAQVSDNAYATLDPVPVTTYATRYLQGLELANPPEDTGQLTEIRVLVEIKTDDEVNSDMTFSNVHLVMGGVIQTTINKATAEVVGAFDLVYTYTFTAANLATLGLTIDDLYEADFGAVVALECLETGLGVGVPLVDRVSIEYDQETPVDTSLRAKGFWRWGSSLAGFR